MNTDYIRLEKRARTRRTAVRTVTYILLVLWALVVLFPFTHWKGL